MSDNTKISWTDATWNPVTGCSPVSEGCRNCYAERDWPRLSSNNKTIYFGRTFSDVQLHKERLSIPLKWRRPRKIFVNSMSDLFHPSLSDEEIDQVFAVMALAQEHIFQILTKRPERMKEYFSKLEQDMARRFHLFQTIRDIAQTERIQKVLDPEVSFGLPLKNVWLGVSVENQEAADDRIRILLEIPATLHWISMEPLLGPVSLEEVPVGMLGPLRPGAKTNLPKVKWVVVGGESGPAARPMEGDWLRKIKYECEAANVPLFVKQLGAAYSDSKDGLAGKSLKIPEEAIYLLKRRFAHRSGADIEEWPEEFKKREFPVIF